MLGLIGLAFVAMPTTAVAQNTPPAQAAPQAAPSSAAALSQNTVPPEFAAWWNRLWSIQSGEFYQSGMEIKLRTYNLYRLTDAEAAKLRAEVAGKPEHPRLEELERYQERIQNPRGQYIDSILAFMGGEWRSSTQGTDSQARGLFTDRAWGEDTAWELGHGRLLVMDPSQSAPEYRRFGQQSSDNSYRVGNLLTTGLSLRNLQDISRPNPVVSGLGWTLDFSYDQKDWRYRVISKGAWDPGRRLGTVAEVVVRALKPGSETPLVQLTRASDHRYEPEINWMVPRVVTTFATNGMPEREFEFHGVRTLTKGDFKKLIRFPRSGEIDAVRGRVEFNEVQDMRGQAAAPAAASAQGSGKPAASATDGRSYRWLGWALAASLAAVFVGLRLRNAR